MTKVKPNPDCNMCHGEGVVYDLVPYGDTNVQMPTTCECVLAQLDADDETGIDIDGSEYWEGHDVPGEGEAFYDAT
jgi:hypothetical protein